MTDTNTGTDTDGGGDAGLRDDLASGSGAILFEVLLGGVYYLGADP